MSNKKVGRPTKPIKERFLSKIEKTKSCWNWIGSIDKYGYGYIKLKTGKHRKAHRLSYEIFIGKIPENLFVCHTCDNPKCVNPKHLFVGSARDNMKDAINKKRALIGEKNPRAKLTTEQVKEIRFRSKSEKTIELAREFNVSTGAIQDIKHNRNWRNIDVS